MYDSEKIRAAAESVIKARCAGESYTRHFAACEAYDAEATPETVLSLLDEIEALRSAADRYWWLEKRFRVFGLDMGNNHMWAPSGEIGRIRGATLSDAIDKAIAAQAIAAMTQGGDA